MEHLFFVTNLLINLPILMWDQGLSFALKVVQNVSFPGNFAYALNEWSFLGKFSLKIHGCLDRCSNCQSYITINKKRIIFEPGVTLIKIQMEKETNIKKLHICNSNSGFFKMKNFLENDLEDTLLVAVLEKRCKSNIRPNWYQQIQQFRRVNLKNFETVGVYESAIIITCFGNCGTSSHDLPLYRFEQPGYGPLEENFVLTFQNLGEYLYVSVWWICFSFEKLVQLLYAETYSEPTRTSTIGLFCENSQRLKAINYFRKKAP